MDTNKNEKDDFTSEFLAVDLTKTPKKSLEKVIMSVLNSTGAAPTFMSMLDNKTFMQGMLMGFGVMLESNDIPDILRDRDTTKALFTLILDTVKRHGNAEVVVHKVN